MINTDHIPIIRTFRNKLKRFRFFVKENWRLGDILTKLERLYCILTCEGDVVSDDVEVTSSITRIRRRDSMAKRTIVTNIGTIDAVIYEDGAVIKTLQPEESWQLPLQGRLQIDGKTNPTSETLTELCVTTGSNFDSYFFVLGLVAGEINVGDTLKIDGEYYTVDQVSPSAGVSFFHVAEDVDSGAVTDGTSVFGVDPIPQSTTIAVVTYRRCLCGDPSYAEGDYTPIGGDLI